MNGRREWVWGEREEREKRENREREEEFHEYVRVARPGWLIVNERWKKTAKEGDREWNVERERSIMLREDGEREKEVVEVVEEERKRRREKRRRKERRKELEQREIERQWEMTEELWSSGHRLRVRARELESEVLREIERLKE